jgi:hypothetical protein
MRLLARADNCCYRRGDEARIDDRREFDHRHIQSIQGRPPGELQGQASFADTAHPDKRHEPSRKQQGLDLVELLFATHEAAQWHRQNGRYRLERWTRIRFKRRATTRRYESGVFRFIQADSFGQASDRVGIRRPPRAALQVRHAAQTQPGPFGQRLLGQTGPHTMLPQQGAEAG